MEKFEVPFYQNGLRVVSTSKGVVEISWQKRKPKPNSRKSTVQKSFEKQLSSYLKGNSGADFKIDWEELPGTEFQKSVWKKMWKIPYGKTRSYCEIAKSLDKPGAARAVGTACGKNPVLLAIPCHRVVGTQGLGGFSGGGIPVKKKLLRLENVL